MEHFSHDHPLILNLEHKSSEDERLLCYACEQPILGPSYDCERCLFFLHKTCAELPREMIHPSHREHPLILLLSEPSDYFCDVCGENCTGFVYHCDPCEFDVDIKCALITHAVQQKVEHNCHPHQLIPIQKPTLFFCDACGTKHEGTSYLCITCSFWVNQKCASVPTAIKLSDSHHLHPLTLIYSIPRESYTPQTRCKICEERIYRGHWVYACSEYRYFVHLNCATLEAQQSMASEHQDHGDNQVKLGSTVSRTIRDIKDQDREFNPISLPMADEFIDPITQFIKDIKLQGNYREVAEIVQDSHEHQLKFVGNQDQDEECSETKQPQWSIEGSKDEQCYGCDQTISAPFYYCPECNFSLHQWCAEVPKQLRHTGHPAHPLLLMTKNLMKTPPCRLCRLGKDTYIYGCEECNYYVDAKCAFLPRTAKHEGHRHPLALRQRSAECKACGHEYDACRYLCGSCKYNICIGCILFPQTIGHRYDKHPFVLIYDTSLLDHVDDEYYCEICEEEIDIKYWFYHCNDCNQSLHARCIRPTWWRFDFGNNRISVKVLDHPHHLKIVEEVTRNYPCAYCRKYYVDGGGKIFKCTTCNYWTHPGCINQVINI